MMEFIVVICVPSAQGISQVIFAFAPPWLTLVAQGALG